MADYDISNVTRRVVYAASGTGPYAFTFEILSQTDIDVYKGDTLLTLTTDYSVTINLNGTGSVTLVATAGTSNITIVGARNIQRTTDFVTGGDFFANTLNDELDSQTIFIQQVAETAERGLKAPVTDPTDINMTLPRKADRAGKYLAFDANGDPQPGDTAVEVAAIAAIADEIVAVAAIDTEVVAVSGNASNINTVAGNNSNITTVAGVSAAVSTVAANIVDIQNAEENADAAAASAILANDWATKTSGAVAGGEYSAKYHAQAASTSAGNASTSATAAQNAQTAAESARDQTLTAFDNFDDRYLGTKISDPTLDNDGNSLVAGALYFNSSAGVMKVYTGSAWVAAYVSGTGFVASTSANASAVIPAGSDAQRDVSPSQGYFRFNTDSDTFEGYDGVAWGEIGGGGGGATGAGGDKIFVENGQTVTTSYSIPSLSNAMSTGPIAIDAGVTVTIPSGSVWAII